MTHRHGGADYPSGNDCPLCWEQACDVLQGQLDKVIAERDRANEILEQVAERLRPIWPVVNAFYTGTLRTTPKTAEVLGDE